MRAINCLVIHHSASKEGSVAQFTVEHRARGFGTIGYHYLIGNGHGATEGEIYVGRPEWQKGCGVFGANTGKLHICLVGNFHKPDPGYTGRPSRAQLDALGHWLLIKGTQYKIPANKIVGHKEITVPGHGTACPGDQMPLNAIRAWYQVAQLARHLGKSVPTLSEYLLKHDYPTKEKAEAPAKPKVVFDLGSGNQRYATDVLSQDGKTYLRAEDIALLLNWPQPIWDAQARQLTIYTKSK